MMTNEATIDTTKTPAERVLEIHQFLASVCDGAIEKDYQGYNAADQAVGHGLALLPSIEGDDLIAAWSMSRKYVGQIEAQGLTIPTAAEIGAEGVDIKAARERLLNLGRAKKAAEKKAVKDAEKAAKFAAAEKLAEARRPAEVTVSLNARLAVLILSIARTQTFGAILSAIKALPRRRYVPTSYAWEVPLADNALLAAALAPYRVRWAPGTEPVEPVAAPATSGATSNPSAEGTAPVEAPKPKAPGRFDLDGKVIRVYFDYNPDFVSAVKAVPGARFTTDPTKHWTAPLSSGAALAAAFPQFDGVEVIAQLGADALKAEQAAKVAANQDAVRRLRSLGDLSAPLPNGRVLFGHQRSGVEFLLERGAAILADDMGLGKTTTALMAAKAYQLADNAHVFVICPASLKENWRREAAMVGVKIEVYSWAKQPEPVEGRPYVVIADEAHYAQTYGYAVTDKDTGKVTIKGSKRTYNFLQLASKAAACFALTGTPIKNGRPVNLFPLLRAVNHELARNKGAYEKRYCAAHDNGWGWDVTGAAHLDELHQKTKNVMLRRIKSECLDLPKKTRILQPCEVSAKAQAVHNQTFNQLRDEYDRRVAAGEISDEGDALVMLTHLRKASSVSKIETAIEMAEELIEQGRQVVIFGEFHETVETIAAALGVPFLHGGVASEGRGGALSPRQKMVDDFQAGRTRAFVSTVKAGGVGITLTAASTVIMVDRPWTPGDAVQAEDRCFRIGQTEDGTAYWLQAQPVDEKIDTVLENKQGRIEMVLQGERKTMRATGATSARDLLRSLFHGEAL